MDTIGACPDPTALRSRTWCGYYLHSHSVVGGTLDGSKNGRGMFGCLKSADSDECIARFSPSGTEGPKNLALHSRVARNYTIMYMRELLDAAGIRSLEEANDADDSVPPKSYRRKGMVIGVNVRYTNMETYNQNHFDFYITATKFQATYSRVIISPIFIDPNDTYAKRGLYQMRQGVLLLFTASGEIGAFEFQTLLTQLTT